VEAYGLQDQLWQLLRSCAKKPFLWLRPFEIKCLAQSDSQVERAMQLSNRDLFESLKHQILTG